MGAPAGSPPRPTPLPEPADLLRSLTDTDPLVLVPRLTVGLLMSVLPFQRLDPWVLVVGSVAVACVLLVPRLTTNGWIFLAVGLALTYRNLADWERIDNHYHLVAWWTVAVGCALLTRDPRRSLAVVARALIGLTFAFAVYWKFAANAFVDGRFFEFTMLTDNRMRWIADHAGGLGPAAAGNIDAFEAVQAGTATPPETAELASSGRLRAVATAMSLWGIAIEATLAVLYLLPRHSPGVERARTAALVAFCVSTYLLLPVVDFAGVLLIMGIASCPPNHRRILLGTLAVVLAWATLVGATGWPW